MSFDFDAVRRVLSSVAYHECASGSVASGDGSIEIVFDGRGDVLSTSVAGPYSATLATCVQAHFAVVRIPPFDQPCRVIGWKIHP